MAVIGIDFGSSYSSASWINPKSGKAEPVVFRDNDVKLPSTMLFNNGGFLCGYQAESYLAEVNKLPPEYRLTMMQDFVPCLKGALSATKKEFFGDKEYSYTDLLATYFKYMVGLARQHCGSDYEITDVVFSHPVAFSEAKVAMMREAFERIGLKADHCRLEPVAAILGHTRRHEVKEGEGLLVFDFGGGTIDVAFVRKAGGKLRVSAKPRGDSHCGGNDLDYLVYEHFRNKIKQEFGGYDITRQGAVDFAILNICRKLKECFSGENDTYSIPGMIVVDGKMNFYNFTLSREAFGNIIYAKVADAVNMAKMVAKDAKENGYGVDRVLLIGGSSRLTLVSQLLAEAFPNAKLETGGERDIVVALGNIVDEQVEADVASPEKPDDTGHGDKPAKDETATEANPDGAPYDFADIESRLRTDDPEKKSILARIARNMVFVEGGTFQMGSAEFERHMVTLDSFYICKYEVTQKEWEAFTGHRPNTANLFNGDNYPVEDISWNQCQAFINTLNELSGMTFRLPTEAEWEFAARGGKNPKHGYNFSGSDDINQVAWTEENSDGHAHEVGRLAPNDLGLYDMSGNVYEWCGDWYGSYPKTPQVNPKGAKRGEVRITRGGSYRDYDFETRVHERHWTFSESYHPWCGLRLALDAEVFKKEPTDKEKEDSLRKEKEVVANIIKNMVYVEGGTFNMGVSYKKSSWKDFLRLPLDNEPAHPVRVDGFHICKYEVTQKEWETIMGHNPSDFEGENRPVEHVSWNECQQFIQELRRLAQPAQINFRLPTEAEWEFAALGGNKSKGYSAAGSDKQEDVAWVKGNSEGTTHDVGLKQPNELGLYDMCGNVREWCNDWYARYDYNRNAPTLYNPKGPAEGSVTGEKAKVVRGDDFKSIYVSVKYRFKYAPDCQKSLTGLRLVF